MPIIRSAYSLIRSGYWAISPQRSSSGARYSTPSFCTASNNLSSHLLLVAWSAVATVRIGISSFTVRKTAAPRAPDEVRQREDFDASKDGAVALSQARDHPRRER